MIQGLLGEGYIEESLAELNIRYNRFGKDLYKILEKEMPAVFNNLKYYHKTIPITENSNLSLQCEDSFAVYKKGNNLFSIQIDPDCEVICLWNEKTNIEIGNWGGTNYYKQAIDFIKAEFL